MVYTQTEHAWGIFMVEEREEEVQMENAAVIGTPAQP
jgi:hypothetical protein